MALSQYVPEILRFYVSLMAARKLTKAYLLNHAFGTLKFNVPLMYFLLYSLIFCTVQQNLFTILAFVQNECVNPKFNFLFFRGVL